MTWKKNTRQRSLPYCSPGDAQSECVYLPVIESGIDSISSALKCRVDQQTQEKGVSSPSYTSAPATNPESLFSALPSKSFAVYLFCGGWVPWKTSFPPGVWGESDHASRARCAFLMGFSSPRKQFPVLVFECRAAGHPHLSPCLRFLFLKKGGGGGAWVAGVSVLWCKKRAGSLEKKKHPRIHAPKNASVRKTGGQKPLFGNIQSWIKV